MEAVEDKKFLEEKETMGLSILLLNSEIRSIRQENLKLKAENNILRSNATITQLEMEKVSIKKDLDEFKAKLKEEYEIKDDKWGFDPKTGEIT